MEGFGLTPDARVNFLTDICHRMYLVENGKLVEKALADVVEDNWVFVDPERVSRLAPLIASPS